MDPKSTEAPPKDSEPPEPVGKHGRSARSAASVRPAARSSQTVQPGPPAPSARSVKSARVARPEKKAEPKKAEPKPKPPSKTESKPPSKTESKPPAEPVQLQPSGLPEPDNEKAKAAIQKRAEGRAKVPHKFRDSIKRFFFSPTGMLKILRLGVIVGALTFFLIAEAHESFIAITVLESCIVLLFIITYMLTLHHLLTCLRWSLLSAKQQEADKAKYEQLSLDMWKTLLVMESSNHGEVSEGKLKSLSMENVKKGRILSTV